jgi:hypothetical protein
MSHGGNSDDVCYSSITDIDPSHRDVRFAANSGHLALFDYLAGKESKLGGSKADSLNRLQIDDQLYLSGSCGSRQLTLRSST